MKVTGANLYNGMLHVDVVHELGSCLLAFRQASQAQAGDYEFVNFRCLKVSVLAIAGDGQLGVDAERSAKFGACRVEPAEMGIGDDFDPHRCDHTRSVVQGAVGPFDRLFEASPKFCRKNQTG